MTAQQDMIVQAFNSQVYIEDRMDVQNTPIYDTLDLAAAATINSTNSTFFSDVGAASGKTLALTNLTQPNRLAAPEAFSIFGIRLRWSEDVLAADLQSVLDGFALNFVLGTKSYNLAPLWYYASGGGIAAVTTRTDASFYTNGVPTRESMHKLAITIVIENQMNFSAQLVGDNFTLATAQNGGTGIRLQLLLDGLYARGVQ